MRQDLLDYIERQGETIANLNGDVERLENENARLRAELKSKEGEIDFLYGNYKDVLIRIVRSRVGNVGDHQIYSVQVDKEWIDNLISELNPLYEIPFENPAKAKLDAITHVVSNMLDDALSYGEYQLTKNDITSLAKSVGYDLPDD